MKKTVTRRVGVDPDHGCFNKKISPRFLVLLLIILYTWVTKTVTYKFSLPSPCLTMTLIMCELLCIQTTVCSWAICRYLYSYQLYVWVRYNLCLFTSHFHIGWKPVLVCSRNTNCDDLLWVIKTTLKKYFIL